MSLKLVAVGCLTLSLAMSGEFVRAAATIDFNASVKPLLESACLRCHQGATAEGGVRLDSRAEAIGEGESTASVTPGAADESLLIDCLSLPEGDARRMPPDGPPLAAEQIAVLNEWINAGAEWPADATLETQPRIDFAQHVQPILEMYCLSCHAGEHLEGDLNLATRDAAFAGGMSGPAIVAFNPEESPLYALCILPKDDPQVMPPAAQGGPLTKDSLEILRLWIAQGAIWPEGVTLQVRPKPANAVPSPDDMQLVRRIHAKIVETAEKEAAADYVDYAGEVPETGAPYEMVALQGDVFPMGSPDDEPGRQADEGPITAVKLDPFWIGKYEVSWDEYEPYMLTGIERLKNGMRKDFNPAVHGDVDAVSQPTTPYVEMSFGMGQYGYPAISMTQHGANKYCQWLSAQTGHFYRLPTEAEWEYACRAGTDTAYSFGDEATDLDDYAWYAENSEEKYQLIGQKRPNAWGLHDMHGNVAEWTADQFIPDYFKRLGANPANPFMRPATLYPRSVRGGGWADGPELLRSAARRGSEASWQQQDPQLPKSQWYLTDAPWLGFRIVRPRKIPSVEEMYFYWNSSSNKQ